MSQIKDKSGSNKKKYFFGLFMFFAPLGSFYVLFETIDYFIKTFPDHFTIIVFIVVGIIVVGIVNMVISLFTYNHILKKFFNEPKHLVEYSFDSKKPHAKKYYFLMSSFDPYALGLWRKSSKWLHAKSHSRKIEKKVITDEVKLWQIIQPASYDSGDDMILEEFAKQIKEFRGLLKKFLDVKNGS